MKKAIIILLAAAVVAAIPAIALCMAASAFDGKPGFSAGGANGAWLWMEPAMNRLHVRFSTTGNEKRFFGSICGDKMSDLIIYKVNEQPENKDAAKIAGDAHCLTFNFKAKKNLVGFYVTPDGEPVHDGAVTPADRPASRFAGE